MSDKVPFIPFCLNYFGGNVGGRLDDFVPPCIPYRSLKALKWLKSSWQKASDVPSFNLSFRIFSMATLPGR